MKQMSLAQGGFAKYPKASRRAEFLAQMDRVVPWKELCELIEPHYPKAGRGRPPVGLERMLRLHFLQHWYNLSDPALEEELLESESMRRFVGIDLGHERVPDETTVCKFRHLLERHGLGERIFQRVGEHLRERGFRLSAGTIVDATLISAPTSTKNRDRQRDPEMGTTKKGGQWLFGMKAHIGVDDKSKLIHTVKATPGNTADAMMLRHLLHGRERRVWGDKAYFGLGRVIKEVAPRARDLTQLKNNVNRRLTPLDEVVNRIRSKTRAKVEHCFGVIKCIFGWRKLRYRGLAKNANRLMTSAALCNLYMVRHKLA
ncbi:MAG TPA: IS5 family transposase [Planctomycetota bacterium]|nr:IS5 family transposase [Planctomycetota bacterium]